MDIRKTSNDIHVPKRKNETTLPKTTQYRTEGGKMKNGTKNKTPNTKEW